MATVFKIFRWAFISLLVIVIVLRIYQRISSDIAVGTNDTLVILAFLAVLLFRNKMTWILGLVLFIGGLYNLFFVAYRAAEPTAMQFSQSIIRAMFNNSYSSLGAKLVGTIPDFFCVTGLVFFITPRIRHRYLTK